MRLRLATKIAASILGVLALAVISSTLALVSAWQIGELFEGTVAENIPSVRATEELEIALLEQRGCVASYILDGGNPAWLKELRQREPAFDDWLVQARHASRAPEEEEIVARLLEINRRYETKRDEVIAMYDRGAKDQAKALLLGEVNELYNEVFKQCEDFIAANQRYVDAAMMHADTRIKTGTWAVGIGLAATVVLGTLLFWLFFQGVLRPLRTMMADARQFAVPAPDSISRPPEDELRVVGDYLRTLMLDVADTRSTLERSRAQLLNAEKLASVGKLAAGVAHEMRNPLTAIKMWLYSIRKTVGGDARTEQKFDAVSNEIVRLEDIVGNFLEFSRPPRLRPRPHALAHLLDKSLELFEPRLIEQQIRLARDEPADLPLVLVDADQFKQMLINLLDNACQSMGQGGEITLHARVAEDEGHRGMIVLRVQDCGSGIAQEAAARIFEPFFTTKDEGTGLGLCIAGSIMARHGGRLILESTSAQGTTFAVWLPIAMAEHHE